MARGEKRKTAAGVIQDVAANTPILDPSIRHVTRDRLGVTFDRALLDRECAQYMGRSGWAKGLYTTLNNIHPAIPAPSNCTAYRTSLLRFKLIGIRFRNSIQRIKEEKATRALKRHESREEILKLAPEVKKKLTKKQKKHRAMPSSCKDIRAALAECLQNSDCVMIERHKPSDCLRPPLLETMPDKCQQLKRGYGECKRGMVDMRKRFRGNQPIAVSKEIEGGGSTSPSGGQLYAGKPAYESTAKETSGNEPIERDWRELENEKYRKE